MQKTQWIVVVVAIVVGLSLFFFGKTTVKDKKEPNSINTELQSVDFKSIEADFVAKNQAPELLKSLIKTVENNPKDTAKILELALAYRDLHQPHLAGHYFYELAKLQNSPIYYERAGNAFYNAFHNNIDTTILNNLLNLATQSYQKTIELEPDNLDVKTSLGEVMVESGTDPMQGVQVLKEVLEKDPNNIRVSILLGRFSLQSGQYDKAKERLEGVLKLEPNNKEAIYFLAFTEAELGNKKRAIELIELCKVLVNNPDFDKEIEHFIKELKK